MGDGTHGAGFGYNNIYTINFDLCGGAIKTAFSEAETISLKHLRFMQTAFKRAVPQTRQ